MVTYEELLKQANILRDLYLYYLSGVDRYDPIGIMYATERAMHDFEFKHRHNLPYKCDFMINTVEEKVCFKAHHSQIVEVYFNQDFRFN
jgi:hypothetical protein